MMKFLLLLNKSRKLLRWSMSVLMVLFFINGISAQSGITVSGKILDNRGEPLPGATVLIRGTSQGTTTDIEGNYVIDVGSDQVLIYSFLGFLTQEVPINNRSVIDIQFEVDAQTLQEVVVIGYGEIRKSDLTGSVSAIRSEAIQRANANDVLSALEGRVTGVQITEASGAPGAGVNIQVRGINSINAGTSPLFVVDGIQIGASDDRSVNPLIDLDPADIESMEVLKDASATAIYGARGSNGVVLITTKKGREGTSQIDASFEYGVTSLVNDLELLDQREFLEHQVMLTKIRALRNDPALAFRPSIYDLALAANLDQHPDFRPWTEKLISDGSNAEFNISASGGSKKGNYRISLGVNDQDGILKNSGLERINARITLNQEINDRISIGFNVSGARVKIEGVDETGTNNGIFRRLVFTNPYLPLLNDPNRYLGEGSGDLEEEVLGIEDSVLRSRNSPENFFLTETAEEINQTYRGRLNLDYEIIPGLVFGIAGNFNTNLRFRTNTASPESRNAFDTNGEVRLRENRSTTWIAEAKLSYNGTIATDHRISAIAVGEMQETVQESTDITNQNFGDFISGVNNFGSGTVFLSAPFRTSQSSLSSVLGRVNYTYKDRYLLTFSGRLDASSKFPDGNKTAFFPAGAVGWNVHEESFMEPIEVVTNLKLRASIGQTGNQSIPVGASQTTYDRDLIVLGDGSENDQPNTVWVPRQLGNAGLVWEKHTTWDMGLEVGLFNNRLSLETGYFNKDVSNVLFERPLPAHLGFTEAFDNIGEIQSFGWEHSLEAVVVSLAGFTLSINANASFIKSFTRRLTNENDFLIETRAEGWQFQFARDQPIGNWRGFIFDGVYSTPEELSNAPGEAKRTQFGLLKYYDVNMDGIADDNDISVIGNTLPFTTGGFGATLTWKGFDLHTFFQFSQGADIVNTNIRGPLSGGGSDNTLRSIVISNYSEFRPLAESSSHFSTNGENSNRNIENGSFIRWSNLNIGYNVPAAFLEKNFRLSRARISVQANNLMVFTKYSWFDPEVNSLQGNNNGGFIPGFDDSVYPRSRLIQFAIHLGL